MVEICEYLRDHGRGILSVRLNGEAVTPDGLLSRLKGRPLSDILTIEIESAEIQRLVTEALAELQDAVVKLPELCRQLAELFQSETPEQAYAPFHKLAEIWGAVKARELQVAQALSLDLELAELKGVRFDEHHQELNQYLGEAAQAIESGDCVGRANPARTTRDTHSAGTTDRPGSN